MVVNSQFDSKTTVTKSMEQVGSEKVITVTLESDPWKCSYKFNCKSVMRPAVLAIDECELEGNGCTFLFEKPTMMFIGLRYCKNVKVKNIKEIYEEHTSTQGTIISVDEENLTFKVKLDDGFPNISTDEWRENIAYAYYFGQLYHPTENRIKITKFDTVTLSSIREVGDRVYEIDIPLSRKNMIDCYEVGDRLVIPTRNSNYDTPAARQKYANIELWGCTDVLIDGVTVSGSAQLGVSAGLCSGRIKFKNYTMKAKDGALLAVNSDGIHYWRNRGGLVLENSYMGTNLDDHINTKGEDTELLDKIDSRHVTTEESWMYKMGDELAFFDTDSKHIVGKAFVKEYKNENGRAVLTLDRDIDLSVMRASYTDKASNPTRVYDLNVVGEGTVIRNNDFVSSRRHAYIGRSQNSIFEGNRVIDCGGSAVAAMNEVRAGKEPCEGLFPSAFTFKDNYIEGKDGNTSGYYPLEVNSFGSTMSAESAIDGFLVENNTFNIPNKDYVMVIKAAKDLYMYNNKITYDKDMQEGTVPVVIANTEIKDIDGLELSYSGTNDKERQVINILGCKVNETDIKNVKKPDDKSWKEFTIE